MRQGYENKNKQQIQAFAVRCLQDHPIRAKQVVQSSEQLCDASSGGDAMSEADWMLSENENKGMMEAIEDREPEECPVCGAMLPRDIEFQQLHIFRCHPVGMEGRE